MMDPVHPLNPMLFVFRWIARLALAGAMSILLFGFSLMARAQEDPPPLDDKGVLQAFIESQRATNVIEFRVDTETKLTSTYATARKADYKTFVHVRRRDCFLELIGPRETDPSQYYRHLLNDKIFLTYHLKDRTGITSPPVPNVFVPIGKGGGGFASINKATVDKERTCDGELRSSLAGFSLDGYLGTVETMRCAEMLKAFSKEIRANDEVINQQRCLTFSGQTPYGTISVSIEPKSLACLKLVFSINADDLLRGEPLSSRTQNLYVKKASQSQQKGVDFEKVPTHIVQETDILDGVTTERISGCSVAVRGHLTSTIHYENGEIDTWQTSYVRSGVKINPTFPAWAFKADLPNGAPLSNADDSRSGVKYVWKDGTIKPLELDVSEAGAHGDGTWWTAVKIIAGLLFWVGLLWFFLRRRRKTEAKEH